MYRATLWKTRKGKRQLDPEDWTKRQEAVYPSYEEALKQADFWLGFLAQDVSEITITSPNGYELEVDMAKTKKVQAAQDNGTVDLGVTFFPEQDREVIALTVRDALNALARNGKDGTMSEVKDWFAANRPGFTGFSLSPSEMINIYDTEKQAMAKKKTEEQPATPAVEATPAEAPTHKMADVLRKALEANGVEASTDVVRNWIAGNYPGWSYNVDSFASSLSGQRKKMRGGSSDDSASSPGLFTPTTTRARTTVAAQTTSEPSLSDLFAVQALAMQSGGVDACLKLVEQVATLAEQAGGMDKLQKCLAALAKLTGK